MSGLVAIYDTLAAQVVEAGGESIAATALDALPQAVETAAMPMRLLLPFAERATGDAWVPYTPGAGRGRGATIEWHLTDLLFLASVGQGKGVARWAPVLAEYQSAYVAMLQRLQWPRPNQQTTTGLQLQAGVFDWPRDSGRFYFGCRCLVSVKEIL